MARSFATILTEACKAHHISLSEVAKRLDALGVGVDKGTLSRWRSGKSLPGTKNIETLRRLPRALGMTTLQTQQFHHESSLALGYRIAPEGPVSQPSRLAHRQHLSGPSGSSLSGRSRELARLEKWLGDRQPVIITGMGGVGKTRLAQAAVQAVVGKYAHGCEYLALTPGQSSLEVLRNAAHLLGVQVEIPASTSKDPQQAKAEAARNEAAAIEKIRLQLGGVQLLFQVDNLETPDQVRRLVQGLPGITWLFTARRLSLKSLVNLSLNLQPPASAEALEIFTNLAPSAAGADPKQLEQIVERLGRLPLALRLAAGLLESGMVASVEALHAWLQARSLIQSRSFAGQLRALCNSLLAAMPPEAQQLFILCGLFEKPKIKASLALQLAQRLGYQPGPQDWEILGDLALVEFPAGGEVTLHPLLHEYARLRLSAWPNYQETRSAFQQVIIEYAETVAYTPDETQRDYWLLLNVENDLLRVGQELYKACDWPALKRLYPAATGYLWSSGNLSGYDLFDGWCLEAAVASRDLAWEAKICAELGFLRYEQHDWAGSESLLLRAQNIADQMEAAWFERARSRRYRALLARAQKQFQVSLDLLAEAGNCLERESEKGNKLDTAWMWLHTARMGAYYRLGDLAQAAAAGEQADAIGQRFQTAGGYRFAGYKILLGDVYLAQKDPAAALQTWQSLLDLYANRPPLSDHADVYLRQAWVYAAREELELSLQTLEAARSLYARFGDVNGFERAQKLLQAIQEEENLPDYRELMDE